MHDLSNSFKSKKGADFFKRRGCDKMELKMSVCEATFHISGLNESLDLIISQCPNQEYKNNITENTHECNRTATLHNSRTCQSWAVCMVFSEVLQGRSPVSKANI